MGTSSKQRSISVRGDTYRRARQHCNREGITIGRLVEQVTADIPEVTSHFGNAACNPASAVLEWPACDNQVSQTSRVK